MGVRLEMISHKVFRVGAILFKSNNILECIEKRVMFSNFKNMLLSLIQEIHELDNL